MRSEGRHKTVRINRNYNRFFSAVLLALPMKFRIRANQEHRDS